MGEERGFCTAQPVKPISGTLGLSRRWAPIMLGEDCFTRLSFFAVVAARRAKSSGASATHSAGGAGMFSEEGARGQWGCD